MFNGELCKKCCHYGPCGCDSTKRFCVDNDHFVPNLRYAFVTTRNPYFDHKFSLDEDLSETLPTIKFIPQPKIENVIFNDPATIVFWDDGTKTVVKNHDGVFDPEKGLAMAIAKKALGNNGSYYEEFKKWLPKEEERESSFCGISKALKNLSMALSNINMNFPVDPIPKTEDIPSCTDCLYCSTEIYEQPCRDCLDDISRPGFKKSFEKTMEELRCLNCIHFVLDCEDYPCKYCFYDERHPKFEKKTEDK